ncbi:hypothetical protein PV10_09079 [Exophiala mesophila]|uniref:Wax synthase domain-containing protein n=1 Tax=Exophiala mesophila TaxID=212818 RepID=A0A0D1WH69_EXOME|nr:uncharacterized protein PV10_09079 [Exophiala mesophila]KIV88155.1 hypothetical protein PV10_09079 [Exophiala mesophila]
MQEQYVSLYRRILAQRQHEYDASLLKGDYTPFLYPWDCLPIVYLLLALALTPRLRLGIARPVRCIVFGAIVLHSIYICQHRRTLWCAGGYGIGLCLAWGAIMSFTLLICNDVGQDFWRLELRHTVSPPQKDQRNGDAIAMDKFKSLPHVDLMRRKIYSVHASTGVCENAVTAPEEPAVRPYRLVWQSFPGHGDLIHLLDWIVDLTTAFRGVSWSHRIPILAPIDSPNSPMPGSGQKTPNRPAKATSIPKQTLRALQRQALKEFFTSYILLDLLKTTMVTDPYFLGLEDLRSPTPWNWLRKLTQNVPIATRLVRLIMSMAGVVFALTLIFSLSPLFFALILPSAIDISRITKSPLLEPWMYPAQWYPLRTSVLHSGLAGFWGKFWHQMFRYGISEPSRVVIKNLKLERDGNTARVIQLGIAFTLSGFLHAAGSYTSFSLRQTHPVQGPLLFFLLQGFGTIVQTNMVRALHKHFPLAKTSPPVVGQTINSLVVLGWLYFTGPLLANDFARSGIWLLEPVPVSILRGVGFGPGGKDEGWWTWYQEGSKGVGWWTGDVVWRTGLGFY